MSTDSLGVVVVIMEVAISIYPYMEVDEEADNWMDKELP